MCHVDTGQPSSEILGELRCVTKLEVIYEKSPAITCWAFVFSGVRKELLHYLITSWLERLLLQQLLLCKPLLLDHLQRYLSRGQRF